MKKFLLVLLITIFTLILPFSVLAASSSDTNDIGVLETESNNTRSNLSETEVRNLPSGRVTYILKEIPHPENSINSLTFRGYLNLDPTLAFGSINIASAAAQYSYIRCYSGSTHVFDMYVGDYFTADPDWTPNSTAQAILDQYFDVVEWMPDDTSPYNNIRSTLSHYLFNDQFDNVPFGEGWIDFFAILLVMLVFIFPCYVIFYTFTLIFRQR